MSTDMILVGATGRLGRVVLDQCHNSGVRVVGAVSPSAARANLSIPVYATLPEALGALESPAVILDISVAEDAVARIDAAAAAGCPLVQGTTGLDLPAGESMKRAAGSVAVVVAPNFSPGMALLRRAMRVVLAGAPQGWDLAIVDRHHRAKVDRPSGTAAALADEFSGHQPDVVSIRQGGVFGEHQVSLSGDEEELILVHRAFSRRGFAGGALAAVSWASTAEPGLYGMDDVLGGGSEG